MVSTTFLGFTLADSPSITSVMKALVGWLAEETMMEALGIKNQFLPHLGYLGRCFLVRMLTKSSHDSNPSGSFKWMPSIRGSPSLPRSGCPLPHLGLSLWPTRMGTDV